MDDVSAEGWARLRQAAGLRRAGGPATPIDGTPYILGADLAAAAEIAIRLGKPLLLTGEPGTGKTEFARALAAQLELRLEVSNIRSNTTAAELFYSVDEVARFRDAQPGSAGLLPFQYYLTFNALGRAILFAGGPGAALQLIRDRLLRPASHAEATSVALTRFDQLFPPDGFPAATGQRSVVLLDEFDKAPRDTPNDMLNEIERMQFAVPELGLLVAAPRQLRPIVIVTSNSERSLPDPFLRRCIYHDLAFPDDPDRLQRIVTAHLDTAFGADDALRRDALDLFIRLRRLPLTRRPGTAELLDWLAELGGATGATSVRAAWSRSASSIRWTLPTIVKARDDQDRVEKFLVAELGPPGGSPRA